MMEWQQTKLENIVNITMGQSPKSEYYNYIGEGMPFLQGNRTFGDKYPTFDTYTTNPVKIANVGDIIMSVRAPVGDLNITPVKMCLGRGVCSLRMKNNNQEFLFYLMKYYVKDLLNRESGTVFGSVNKNDIGNLNIFIPKTSDVQKKIASVLSVLDDKIELNNKINQNLELQAQALFKSWFIDFAPFGGTMPEDWRVGKLSEITEISSGKRPATKMNYETTEYPYPIVGASCIMGFTNQVLYEEKILITGRVGTHGIVQRFSTKCWASDNTLVIKSPYYEYAYQLLNSIDYSAMNRGSTQPLITQTDLKNKDVIIPKEEILIKYEQVVGQLMKLYEHNQYENTRLAQLRDTLLPKLMSGELDVSQVDISASQRHCEE